MSTGCVGTANLSNNGLPIISLFTPIDKLDNSILSNQIVDPFFYNNTISQSHIMPAVSNII